MVLYHVATPHMDTPPRRDDVAVFHIHTGLLYPSIEHVVSKIEALVEQRSGEDAPSALVMDMSGVLYMDFTALLELERVLGFVEGKLPHTRISISNVGAKI